MLCNMLVTRGKMRTNAGQGWTPGNAMQDAGERCEQTLGKAGHQAMLCKMLVTRGKMRTNAGQAGHQAMLCKMLVTRGKMRTNAGQGRTPGNAMQDAGDEGKDANKRWARLDTRHCYARCWGRGEEGKEANKRWASLDTRQCYARCW